MANITGWGRGAWGEGAWNAPIPVVVSGIEQVTNGEFDSNTTGWTTSSNSSASVSGGIVTITANQYHTFSQNLTLDAGRSYTISVLVTDKSGNFYVAIHDGSSVTDFQNVTVGTTTLTFTANSGTNQLRLYPYSSGTGHTLSVDSISVKGAVETEGTTALGNVTVVAQTVASVDFRDSLMATSFSQEFGLTVDGFVQDGQTISNGSDLEDITNTERGQDIVLAAEMDLPSSFSKASCIWECGGTGTGAWLGISEQSGAYFLRFRAGDGTVGNNTANSNLAIAEVAISSLSGFFDGNTHTLVWAVDISAGKVQIYIDGTLVAEGTTSDGSSLSGFAGGANGGFGIGVGDPVAGGTSDDGSTQVQSAAAFTGTIRSDLRMYKNEFIATQTNSTQTGTSVVAVSGNQGSGQIGDEVTKPQGIFGVTGVQGSTALNSVSAAPQTIVNVTNVAGTGATGSESVSGNANFAVTGLVATSALGNESTVGDNLVVFTGTAGTGAVGTIVGLPSVEVVPTGVSSTGGIGDVLAAGGAKVVEDAVTGTVNLGDEAVSGTANVSVTGVVGTGSVNQNAALTIFTITVVGGNPSNHPYYNVGSANKYAINGSTATADVLLTLDEGRTYRFDQSDSSNSGHPLRFSTTANGTHGGGSEYTTGVTTNGTPGQAGAYTEITVAHGAPTLYYYCTNHSAMGWQANTDENFTTFTITVVGGNPSNHPNYNVGSSNKYAVNGSTATADVVLDLIEGQRYRFDQSDSSNSGHPLRFTADAASQTSAASSSLTEYTTGVTTNGTPGQAGAYTEIVVASDAPTLYYYCTNHSAMGATLNTVVESAVVVIGAANTGVTGLVGTSALGTGIAVIPVIVSVTGSGATSSLGTATSSAISNIVITGVVGTGTLGTLNLYGIIANEVSVSYTEVVPSQNANYEAA